MTDTILVVDDDLGIQKQLKWSLTDYNVVFADDHTSAIAQLRRFEPKVVTLDLGLPPDPANASEGLRILHDIIALAPRTKVIVVTGNNDKQHALKAIDFGAYDFYQKPIDSDTIKLLVHRALNLSKLEHENSILARTRSGMSRIVGNSEAIQKVVRRAEKIANTDISTLLLGESGTGKEVFARSIHEHSPRKDKPFVAINCASIPENLLESELFGYEKGAFTGAKEDRIGRFELAHGGSLFLDELGNLPLNQQVKLLAALQNRQITPVGGSKVIDIDIRLICATNENLEQAVTEGKFRQDLLYRVNTVEIRLPALRERSEDIPLLCNYYLQHFAHKYKRELSIAASNMTRLSQYHWPGNVRELAHAIERAVILSEGSELDISSVISSPSTAVSTNELSTNAADYDTFDLEIIDREPFVQL